MEGLRGGTKVNYAASHLNFPNCDCDAFYNFSLNLAIKVFVFSPCEPSAQGKCSENARKMQGRARKSATKNKMKTYIINDIMAYLWLLIIYMQPRTFPPPLVVCAVSILPNLRRKLPPLTSWGNLILAHILQRNEVLFKISIRVYKKKKEYTLLIYYISMGRLGCICASPPVRQYVYLNANIKFMSNVRLTRDI